MSLYEWFALAAISVIFVTAAIPANATVIVSAVDTSSRVLYAGDRAVVHFAVENTGPDTLEGTFTLHMTDFQGNPAGHISKPVEVHADDKQLVTFAPAIPGVGYFALDVTITMDDTTVAEKDTLWSLAVFERGDGLPNDSPFGTYTIGSPALLAEIVPKGFYRNMAQVGARWGTIDTWWSTIEAVKGQYDWDCYDTWFDAALNAGLIPIPHLYGTPKWISSSPDSADSWAYPAKDWDVFEQFVERFVRRYGDWLVYLRVWNEANCGWWKGTPEQYGEMVMHASLAAKRTKPDIKIIIDTVADSVQDIFVFLDRVHASGATPYWDINGIHNYWLNNTNYPERTPFVGIYEQTVAWTKVHNPEAEVWDTEFACMAEDWGTWWKGVGETKQAQWLARAHVLGLSRGLRRMIWFPGYSWPTKEAPYHNPAGLLRVDLSPRPAYVAYHTVAAALSRASFHEALELGTDQYGLAFKTSEGYVTTLWCVDGPHAGAVTLYYAPGDKVKQTSIMGIHKALTADSVTGALTVDIDENMLFLSSTSFPSRSKRQ